MAITSIKISLDEDLMKEAMEIYDNLGLDLPTAIRIFLRRSVLANGIPFNMTLPGRDYKATLAVRAMQELSDASAANGVRDMTLDEINEEISASRQEREAAGK